jgi:hypothetical protein
MPEKPKGWVKEPVRHGLAAKGIKTKARIGGDGTARLAPTQKWDGPKTHLGQFKGYPDEATDYASDWVDELAGHVDEDYSWDGNAKVFSTLRLSLLGLFQKKLDEKLYDMAQEVKHGERDDWGVGFLEGLRDRLDWEEDVEEWE